jgi:enoyl-[acyl-carrier protein] reductase I
MLAMLNGMKALVVGVANDQSIAWGCAKAFRDAGAEIAMTYLNDRARPFVEPLAKTLVAPVLLPLDVADDAQTDAVFAAIRDKWGRLDIVLHSIAFCPKQDLHARVVDTSREGFGQAMDISVHSFIRLVRRAEPLMTGGGTCMTVTFYGSTRVVDQYNIMGPVKAALEAVTREIASELGSKGIRLHALSPGPLRTRAASGIDDFDELIREAAARAPTNKLATIEDVGAYATFLASPAAKNVTGTIPMIDGGYHITS